MHPPISDRFRGFLPIIIDVETGGFNSDTDALLEIAAVTLAMDEDGILMPDETICHSVIPFEGSNIEQASLDITGINPDDPYRMALEEDEALKAIFQPIRAAVKEAHCNRAIMVAHNAHFDLGFVNTAVTRNNIKRNPFHPFSCFDTATLAGLAYGQTVLAKACDVAEIKFNNDKAHSAAYDAEKTAELFCGIVNRWKDLGGWD
ncbi:MAG: ribonuclease T [Porticoccus sp.]|nr:ribonuclease T [Porticoccus sp.]MBQ0808149.1 ribonuclease T [Porticoccus sp.]MDX2349505.1 ribonuclease T [Porticoccus sp.]